MDSPFTIDPKCIEPAFKTIRTTPPSAHDLEISAKLDAYMQKHFPLESIENLKRRSLILADLRRIFRKWVKQVCLEKGLSEEMAQDAGGQIYVSGSYRLGVNEAGADIDTICVAPRHVTRVDFFSSLKDILQKHPKITNLIAIEGAVVPLLTFDYEDVNIDLQIAILNSSTCPEDINILDHKILVGVDSATEKSLNGPRVTELMIKLIPNRESFIQVLRIARRWAKCRGLYSNKMGYLGGINWCILACFVNQLYPTAATSTLLLRFFMVLANWKWPLAIQLCKTFDADLGMDVWRPNAGVNRFHVMPILTPAYPSMNSSYSVSYHTLAVMNEEFQRGMEIVQEIVAAGGDNWDELFKPSEFFAIKEHYLAVEIYVTNPNDEQAWCSFCESRMRKLVDSLAYIRPLQKIRAFTRKFPLQFVLKEENTTENVSGVCFYVGFDIDKKQLRNSKEIDINSSVDYFKSNDLYRWQKKSDDMHVTITPLSWKNLPDEVFEELGGRNEAKKMRKEYMGKKKEEEEQNSVPSKGLAVKRPLSEDEGAVVDSTIVLRNKEAKWENDHDDDDDGDITAATMEEDLTRKEVDPSPCELEPENLPSGILNEEDSKDATNVAVTLPVPPVAVIDKPKLELSAQHFTTAPLPKKGPKMKITFTKK